MRDIHVLYRAFRAALFRYHVRVFREELRRGR